MKTLLVGLLALALLAGGGWWYFYHGRDPGPAFRTTPARRGELLATIGATGTVEPEEVVDVGAQVGGLLDYFGKDVNGKQVDYGSVVDANTVLAHIDDTLYAADVKTGQASLEQAQANQAHAEADLVQKQALLDQAKGQWERAQKIGPSEALSINDYETYRANFLSAQANIALDQAMIAQAKAGVDQAQASLSKAQENLGYCTIKSPVKGIIIDRRVNAGQTVVASLNAPSLFLIAKDLTRIQVWVSVNEADIGSIHPGQPVTFTVDAYPNDVFKGTVGRVRLNATMTNNVVTYTVEVLTDNRDGRLLPYLTANVQFQIAVHENALLVPNVALRWLPQEQQVAPDVAAGKDSHDQQAGDTPPARPATEPAATANDANQPARPHAHSGDGNYQNHGKVWVVDGPYVRPIDVRIGLSDGTNTEILGDNLADATQVIVGDNASPSAAGANSGNPFVPQFGQHHH